MVGVNGVGSSVLWRGRDPLGFAAGDANLYRYVGNNPVNLLDPNGLSGAAEHHPYPVMLGGSELEQPRFDFTKAQHTAAEQVFKNYRFHNHNNLKLNDAARARWAALTDVQRRTIIAESLRAAGVPESLITAKMDKIMAGSTPGKYVPAIRRVSTVGKGELITRQMMSEAAKLAKLGAALGGLVIMGGVSFANDAYIEAGEKGGTKLATKATLMLELRRARNSGELPSRSFIIKWYDGGVKVQFETNQQGKWITAMKVVLDANGRITETEGYLIKPGDLPLDFRPGDPLTMP